MANRNEFAIVLKAIELRNNEFDNKVDRIDKKASESLSEAKKEKEEWRNLKAEFFGEEFLNTLEEEKKDLVPDNIETVVSTDKKSWEDTVKNCSELLKSKGIDPSGISLPPTKHDLTKTDILSAVLIATIVITLPSMGSKRGKLKEKLNQIQENADNGKINKLLKKIFGDGHVADYLDKHKGTYHRFVSGHDPLIAMFNGVSKEGLKGIIRVFQHLLRDSCGITGIPVPGTTAFLKVISNFKGISVDQLIKESDFMHKNLSEYTALRAEDGLSTALASGLLFGYNKLQDIPDHSMRKPKMAIITHGLITIGVIIATSIKGVAPNFPKRSRINYFSLLAMGKNCLQLKLMINKISKANRRRLDKIESNLEELEKIYSKGDFEIR